MGVGVDRDVAAPSDSLLEQLLGRVLALRPTIDLYRGAELCACGEHVVRVEVRLRSARTHDLAAGAVAQDVDVRVRNGEHHPAGHLRFGHRELRVHRRDDDVEVGEQVVGQVERSVHEDVDLHAGEQAEGCESLVELRDLVELGPEPVRAQAVGDGQAGGMVGDDQVLVPERHRSPRHRLERCAAVGPRGVGMAVTLEQ